MSTSISPLVSNITARMQSLANDRLSWEYIWSDIARYSLPNYARFMAGLTATDTDNKIAKEPSAVERGRMRYDDTAVRAVDRLAAGMESLVTPQSDKWHGLAKTNPLAAPETDQEKQYFEMYRDYMFKVRYNPKSGFIGAHQKAMRSSIAMGTGVVFMEENTTANADEVPVLYRYIPLSECYLAVNAQGEPDTLFRKFTMTARQMIQKFGAENVSGNIRDQAMNMTNASSNLTGMDMKYNIIHAVQPRTDNAGYGAKGAPYASVYVDIDNNTVLSESGFYEFPYIVYYWSPVEDVPYAQSPVMMCLSEIRGVNAMAKVSHKGMQLYMDPPTLSGPEGLYNRMNFNPGKNNPGMLGPDGRPMAQYMQTGARPDFIKEVLQFSRDTINDSLYVSLFQILAQNQSDMTATEALIRANEKGELLGPSGGRIQVAMGQEVERMSGIMIRKGAMHPNSPLAPPDSLRGHSFGARFTSPLDRLRRHSEAIGIQQALQTALPLMQVKPEVADNFDFDQIVRTVTEASGAPQNSLVTTDVRDANRKAGAQQKQAQAALAMAQQGGEAAKNIVPAMQGMSQLAGLPGMPPATGPAPAPNGAQ